jgi:hypothetical protein
MNKRDLATNTTEKTWTDKYWVPGEPIEFDESILDMLRRLPRTYPDLPYPEDDEL